MFAKNFLFSDKLQSLFEQNMNIFMKNISWFLRYRSLKGMIISCAVTRDYFRKLRHISDLNRKFYRT